MAVHDAARAGADDALLTIDELALATDMTVRTTRYYASLGLLPAAAAARADGVLRPRAPRPARSWSGPCRTTASPWRRSSATSPTCRWSPRPRSCPSSAPC